MTYVVRSVLKDLSLLCKPLSFDISPVAKYGSGSSFVLLWIALSYNAVIIFFKLRYKLRKAVYSVDFALSFIIVDEYAG